jgi:hypothetical protein
MPDSTPPVPPSRPRPSLPGATGRHSAAPSDTVARLQTIGAVGLGILLLAVPLYLWRRPRATEAVIHVDAGAPEPPRDAAPRTLALPDATTLAPVKVAAARILECHDKGSSHTAPEQCDHLPLVEKALEDAITQSHACVPPDAGPGAMEFVVDLSFGRKKSPIAVNLPKTGRSYDNVKIAKACANEVRVRLGAIPLGSVTHAHARYKIAAVASYSGVGGT